jgi:hypothetical protein
MLLLRLPSSQCMPFALLCVLLLLLRTWPCPLEVLDDATHLRGHTPR